MLTVEGLEVVVAGRCVQPRASTSLPIWQLALGWVLLIPMFYIAGDGAFIPRTDNVNFAATAEGSGSSASHKMGLALFGLICLVLIAFRSTKFIALARRLKIVLAFPVLAILSCVWSGEPLHSIMSGLVILVLTAFAIYIGSELSFQRQFELIMFVGAIVLPLSIALAILVPSVGTESMAWRGILVSKQNCSGVCTLLLVTALHWDCSGFYQKAFRALTIVMCAVLIAMSQSRTGWLLALVAILLTATIWLFQRMPTKQVLVMLLVGLAGLAASLYGMYIYSSTILALIGKDPTLSQRTIIWAAVWQAASQHPILGYGFSFFWSHLSGPSQTVTLIAGWGLAQAQDGFLDVWLGTGILGVAVIAAMTGQAIRNAVRSAYSESDQAYVRWGLVVILCVLLFNIGESSIGLFRMTWFLFLLACIGLSQVAAAKRYEFYRLH
jgi:exopolysaccharide production protein ExoQ